MRMPDILYHGTTMLRWKLIEKDGYISPNNEGKIYFTSDGLHLGPFVPN